MSELAGIGNAWMLAATDILHKRLNAFVMFMCMTLHASGSVLQVVVRPAIVSVLLAQEQLRCCTNIRSKQISKRRA